MQQFVQVRHQQQTIHNVNIEDEQTKKLKQQMKKLQRQVQQLQKMQLINKQKININQLENIDTKKIIERTKSQELQQMKIDTESISKKQQFNEKSKIKSVAYSYKTQSVNSHKNQSEQISFKKVKNQTGINQLKPQILKIDIKNEKIKNLVNQLYNNPQNKNILHSQSKLSQNQQNLIKNEKKVPFLIRQLRSKSQFNKNSNISFQNTGSNFNIKKTPILNMTKLRGLNNDISSNLFNLSIGDLMEIQKNHQVSNLISQVEYLKGKVNKLQNQHQIKSNRNIKINSQNHIQIKTFRSNQQNMHKLDNKRQKNELNTLIQLKSGRIYHRSKVFQNKSIQKNGIKNLQQKSYVNLQDQLYSIQLKKHPNRLAWNPQMRLTSRRSQLKRSDFNGKMYSTLNIMNKKDDQEDTKRLVKEQSQQKKKTRRRSLVHHNKIQEYRQQINISSQQQNQIKNSEQQNNKLKNQKFQQARKHKQILLDFISDYKCYIEGLLLKIQLPFDKFHLHSLSTIDQLRIIAKQYFVECFGINVEMQSDKSQSMKFIKQNSNNNNNNNNINNNNNKYEYNITKYSNCIYFRLNSQYNMICYFNGQFYFGGWQINLIGQGIKQGFGIEIIQNQQKKQIYQGYYKNNKRNGYGISYFINKYQDINNNSNSNNNNNNLNRQINSTIYSGQWQQNLKHGHGYQLQQNIQYIGQFLQDKHTGYAKIKYYFLSSLQQQKQQQQQQQCYYQGQLIDGIKQGIGKQILFNNDVYYGQFKANKYNGKGQYLWNNGSYFYGQFSQGIRKGYGIWIENVNLFQKSNQSKQLQQQLQLQQQNYKHFDIYIGNYDQNIKNGYGIYRWSNGKAYKGYFKNDLKHGEGFMQLNNHNGKIAKYMWKQGKKMYKKYSQQEQKYRIHNRNLSSDNYNKSESQKDDIYEHLIDHQIKSNKQIKLNSFNQCIKMLIQQLGNEKLQLLPRTALGKIIFKKDK